jgi:hypothetical protein
MVTPNETCPNAGRERAEAKSPPYNHFVFIVLVSMYYRLANLYDADPSVGCLFSSADPF